MVVLSTFMGPGLVQAQNPATPTVPSKQVGRAESPEHRFARSALEDMKVKLAGIRAAGAELGAIGDCLDAETEKDLALMAEYENEHGKQERHTCRLPEAEVTAAIDKYCTPMQKMQKNYAGCSRPVLSQQIAIADIVLEADSKIETLTAQLEHADTCTVVYRATIDKKVSDLTTRQSEQVTMCKNLNQYPPKR
jgi:hypothetical protein